LANCSTGQKYVGDPAIFENEVGFFGQILDTMMSVWWEG
jgi:hypothetical protein